MTKTMFALSLGFAGLILATRAGFAAPLCEGHEAVARHPCETRQALRQRVGMAADNGITEPFASEAGTWTIMVAMPGGATCMVASGRNWGTVVEGDPARREAVGRAG
ncbi:MAG: hypothetical protein DI533_14210 [Cereibacter sphaeroides]|uniref:Uncharacterized protein n=1 Tax=Cereibacter sphaeroides TaxID=1063 RepID=A0A2W5S1C5_CERSP|nr:MAG: hypothetical protein DI533_14210 [Cereibacter sphaeroides]